MVSEVVSDVIQRLARQHGMRADLREAAAEFRSEITFVVLRAGDRKLSVTVRDSDPPDVQLAYVIRGLREMLERQRPSATL